eukprot:jgi/Chlat1/905/Chrsp107S01336
MERSASASASADVRVLLGSWPHAPPGRRSKQQKRRACSSTGSCRAPASRAPAAAVCRAEASRPRDQDCSTSTSTPSHGRRGLGLLVASTAAAVSLVLAAAQCNAEPAVCKVEVPDCDTPLVVQATNTPANRTAPPFLSATSSVTAPSVTRPSVTKPAGNKSQNDSSAGVVALVGVGVALAAAGASAVKSKLDEAREAELVARARARHEAFVAQTAASKADKDRKHHAKASVASSLPQVEYNAVGSENSHPAEWVVGGEEEEGDDVYDASWKDELQLANGLKLVQQLETKQQTQQSGTSVKTEEELLAEAMALIANNKIVQQQYDDEQRARVETPKEIEWDPSSADETDHVKGEEDLLAEAMKIVKDIGGPRPIIRPGEDGYEDATAGVVAEVKAKDEALQPSDLDEDIDDEFPEESPANRKAVADAVEDLLDMVDTERELLEKAMSLVKQLGIKVTPVEPAESEQLTKVSAPDGEEDVRDDDDDDDDVKTTAAQLAASNSLQDIADSEAMPLLEQLKAKAEEPVALEAADLLSEKLYVAKEALESVKELRANLHRPEENSEPELAPSHEDAAVQKEKMADMLQKLEVMELMGMLDGDDDFVKSIVTALDQMSVPGEDEPLPEFPERPLVASIAELPESDTVTSTADLLEEETVSQPAIEPLPEPEPEPEPEPQPAGRVVEFVWHAEGAGSVQLAGSFNNWNPTPMHNEGNRWTLSMHLTPGEHQYKFVENGNWLVDRNARTTGEWALMNNIIWID